MTALLLILLAAAESAETRSAAGAWLPPRGSPYRKYVKVQTLLALEKASAESCPDLAWARKRAQALETRVPQGAAAILDLPGEVSAAAAALLASRGSQTVPVLGAKAGSERSAALACALWSFAPRKTGGREAPPVFILDRGRGPADSRPILPKPGVLEEAGIKRVVYAAEGTAAGDLKAALDAYASSGIEVVRIDAAGER